MTEYSEEAADALRAALRAEQAAVWVYGLASAFASESRVSSAIEEALGTHESRQESVKRLIRESGMNPPVARAAYRPPEAVTDQTSAIQMLVTAEDDCQVGWRSVLDNVDASHWRETALRGLTESATRATRWRITIGQKPAAPAFPGARR